jgi:hypothetical protein
MMDSYLPSADSARYFVRDILDGLPRPGPDTHENVRMRNQSAIDALLAFSPATWAEAMLASD